MEALTLVHWKFTNISYYYDYVGTSSQSASFSLGAVTITKTNIQQKRNIELAIDLIGYEQENIMVKDVWVVLRDHHSKAMHLPDIILSV